MTRAPFCECEVPTTVVTCTLFREWWVLRKARRTFWLEQGPLQGFLPGAKAEIAASSGRVLPPTSQSITACAYREERSRTHEWPTARSALLSYRSAAPGRRVLLPSSVARQRSRSPSHSIEFLRRFLGPRRSAARKPNSPCFADWGLPQADTCWASTPEEAPLGSDGP